MIYTVVFLSVFLAAIFCRKNLEFRKKESDVYYFFYFVFIFLILWLFAGLRNINVGSDTWVYLYHFEEVKGISLKYLISNYYVDIGFYFFTYIISNVIGNFTIYLLIIEFIFLSSVFALIYRKSQYPLFSIFVFICLGLYTFSFSTIRQTLAISFCVWSYLSLDKRKIRSLVLLLIGALFHYSAVVFLPVIILKRFKITKFRVVINILLVVLITVFYNKLIPIFSYVVLLSGSNKTYESVQTGGIGMIAFLLLLYIMFVCTYKVDYEKSILIDLGFYDETYCYSTEIEILFVLMAALIFSATRFNMAAMRLYYYYLFFMVVSIPNLLFHIKKKNNRVIFGAGIVVIMLYFLAFNVFDDPYADSKKLLPYYFFWEEI